VRGLGAPAPVDLFGQSGVLEIISELFDRLDAGFGAGDVIDAAQSLVGMPGVGASPRRSPAARRPHSLVRPLPVTRSEADTNSSQTRHSGSSSRQQCRSDWSWTRPRAPSLFTRRLILPRFAFLQVMERVRDLLGGTAPHPTRTGTALRGQAPAPTVPHPTRPGQPHPTDPETCQAFGIVGVAFVGRVS